MRILILGGAGMLGHRLWMNLNQVHETWVTVHGEASELPDIPEFPPRYILPHVDALRFDQVIRAVSSVRPDWVINCIGLIKQRAQVLDPLASISLNALFPHQLSLVCQMVQARMIHLSTDCVFSGKKGQYVEQDASDAEDLYGRTKFLGEVAYPHAVTVRTSMIGRELRTRYGLVEWFLAQKSAIKGYRKAIFCGFTTDELSHILLHYVLPRPELSGIYHVSSEPISKYDLLMLVKKSFGLSIDILPEEEPIVDRSLDSTRFRRATGYQPPTWRKMIDKLKENSRIYEKLRG
jgi:dTDP-4-dehydrorhamnose reductase